MLASGVSETKAEVMYAAVYLVVRDGRSRSHPDDRQQLNRYLIAVRAPTSVRFTNLWRIVPSAFAKSLGALSAALVVIAVGRTTTRATDKDGGILSLSKESTRDVISTKEVVVNRQQLR